MGLSDAPQAVQNNYPIENTIKVQKNNGDNRDTYVRGQGKTDNQHDNQPLINQNNNQKFSKNRGIEEITKDSIAATMIPFVQGSTSNVQVRKDGVMMKRTVSSKINKPNQVFKKGTPIQKDALNHVKHALLPDHLQSFSKRSVNGRLQETLLAEAQFRFSASFMEDNSMILHFAHADDKDRVKEQLGDQISGSIMKEIQDPTTGQIKLVGLPYTITISGYTDGNPELLNMYRKYVENQKIEKSNQNRVGKTVARGSTKKYDAEGGKEYDRNESKTVGLQEYQEYIQNEQLKEQVEMIKRNEKEKQLVQLNKELLDAKELWAANIDDMRIDIDGDDGEQKSIDTISNNLKTPISKINELLTKINTKELAMLLFTAEKLTNETNKMLNDEQIFNQQVTDFENGNSLNGSFREVIRTYTDEEIHALRKNHMLDQHAMNQIITTQMDYDDTVNEDKTIAQYEAMKFAELHEDVE